MAAKSKTGSGLIWSTKTQTVHLVGDHPERLKFATFKRLPESGLFAAELAAQDPDIQVVVIDAEGNVDLTGIESMPHLVQVLIFDCQRILPYARTSSGSLNLTRVVMPYAAGVTEQIIASPVLRNLEVEDGTLDMLKALSGSDCRVTLRKVKSAVDPTAWDRLTPLDEFEIVQSGKIDVVAPQDGWPDAVNFTLVSSLKGLVRASKSQPFRYLGLEGIRSFDPGASLWDLQAEDAFIQFHSRPPKWLIEAWDSRPDDWANTFRLPAHRLLPGSEDQDWDRWNAV